MTETFAAVFDPADDAFIHDPFPTWARLRAAGRVHASPLGLHVVSRYDDVAALLRDPRLLKGPVTATIARRYGVELQSTSFSLIDQDPPDHTRLRALLARPFSSEATALHRGLIEATVARVCATLDDDAGFDVMAGLAYPLQTAVIGTVLGVPPADRAQLQEWGLDIALGIEVLVRPLEWEAARRSLRARAAAADYFADLVNTRRRRPADDVVSLLLSAEVAGDRLTREELVTSCVFLLVAGLETTVNLIGNGVMALLQHPAQLALLQARPELAASAVDELLRFDPPAHATVRVASADIAIDDVVVAAGDLVLLALGSANRDEQRFAGADVVDVTRCNNRHLAFGAGIHACLGAPLARLVGELTFAALAPRLGGLRVVGIPRRRHSVLVRGFLELRVQSLTSTNER